MLLVFLTGFGAFLLFVIGLRGIDRSWAAELGKPGLFVVNLGLALAAPIPLLAVLTGFRCDGLRAAGVALVYGGFCSLGYKLQYGPQIQLLQWELVPLWGSWVGILVWYLFMRGLSYRDVPKKKPKPSRLEIRKAGGDLTERIEPTLDV